MVDVKLGNKTYTGVAAVKMDTVDGGTATFEKVETVTHISHSAWDNGKFTETLDNGSTLEYTVEFEDGKPVKVTGPDGTVTTVDWGND